MEKLRIHPKAVCLQLLASFDETNPLSEREREQIFLAIESLEIPNGVKRLLTEMSRATIERVLSDI